MPIRKQRLDPFDGGTSGYGAMAPSSKLALGGDLAFQFVIAGNLKLEGELPGELVEKMGSKAHAAYLHCGAGVARVVWLVSRKVRNSEASFGPIPSTSCNCVRSAAFRRSMDPK